MNETATATTKLATKINSHRDTHTQQESLIRTCGSLTCRTPCRENRLWRPPGPDQSPGRVLWRWFVLRYWNAVACDYRSTSSRSHWMIHERAMRSCAGDCVLRGSRSLVALDDGARPVCGGCGLGVVEGGGWRY